MKARLEKNSPEKDRTEKNSPEKLPKDENRAKLGWLIRLRWIAWVGQLLGSIMGLRLGYLAKDFLGLYTTVVCGTAIWNLISKFFYFRHKSKITTQDLAIQFLADIGSLTLLLSMTGGIYNPLSSLLLIHAVLAALLIQGPILILILGLICGSLAFLQWHPEISHLSITEDVTRPILFLSYSLVSLFLASLTAWLSQMLFVLQENVKRLRQQQERMDRLKVSGAMAAGFSHEFATPLYTLKLRIERILRKTSGDLIKGTRQNIHEDAQAAYEAALECEKILREMTQIGLKADQMKLERSSASSTLNEMIQEFIQSRSDTQIDLSSNLSENSEIELPVRPFKQTLFDLLENAKEFSTAHQPIRVKLEERQMQLQKQLVVSIDNEGDEIPPLVLEKWGEPFVTTKSNGTGLGLFNAITLSQAMGGDLKPYRINHSITRFELSLPLSFSEENGCP